MGPTPDNAEIPDEGDAMRAHAASQRAEVKRFFLTAAVFVSGLLVAARKSRTFVC